MGISLISGKSIRLAKAKKRNNNDAHKYLRTPIDEGEKYSSAILVRAKADDQSRMVPIA
jgi:hypothetical protein